MGEGHVIKGGASIGGGSGGVMTPHLFQIIVFSLYSLVFPQRIDPPPHLPIRGAALVRNSMSMYSFGMDHDTVCRFIIKHGR